MNYRARFIALAIVALVVALLPAAVMAQGGSQGDEGMLLRINGPVVVGGGETIDNVVVINDSATIDGIVSGTLVVINGDATISGRVMDDVVVVNGTLTIAETGRVDAITLYRGNLVEEAGSTITGTITQRDRISINLWDWGVFWMLMWLGTTAAIVVAGLVFAGIGGRQLTAAGNAMTRDLGPSLLATGLVWIVAPVLTILILFSIVGIPMGIGYFLFVLPIVWFLGFVVASAKLGQALITAQRDARNPYLAVVVGVLILQVVGLFPVLGGLIAFIAGMIGSGALVVVAWRAWRGSPGQEPAPPVIQQPAPVAGD